MFFLKLNTPSENLKKTSKVSQLSRRSFLTLSALSVFSLVAKDWIWPSDAIASTATTSDIQEKYHLFVPFVTARQGGSQNVKLKSGEIISIAVAPKLAENSTLTVQGQGVAGNDILMIFHSLYDPQSKIGDKIYDQIERASFIKNELTKTRCKELYEYLEDGKPVEDLTALELLDYVVQSSDLPENLKQRYQIASENSRLIKIEETIEKTLAESNLDADQQRLIRGTYEYVRASEPVPNFQGLKDLDAIIEASLLPVALKRNYSIASAKSRAFTVDFLIVDLINDQAKTPEERDRLLSVYQQVRDGQKVSDQETLFALDELILDGQILESGKTVYLLARTRFFDPTDTGKENSPLLSAIANNTELTEAEKEKLSAAYNQLTSADEKNQVAANVAQDAVQLLDTFVTKAKIPATYKKLYTFSRDLFFDQHLEMANVDSFHRDIVNLVEKAGSSVPQWATSGLSSLGAEAGTGVAISNLTGGAATNAMLAILGGGSVASGGLGMLGGLAVAAGGSALIGAAGLLSIALVSQMDKQDFANLGVAGVTGTLAGAGAVFLAWTGASALGVASGLSGAAAISTMIASLGGLSVMTGGASLIAFGTGYVVWSFLKGKKSRDGNILHQLESRLYTLTEQPERNALASYINQKLAKENYQSARVYTAPNIPLDKLSNALSEYGLLGSGEKILALVDTSGFQNAKGIALTNKGISWKTGISLKTALSKPESKTYSELDRNTIFKVAKLLKEDSEQASFDDFLRDLKNQVQSI